jgi:hypothetical protein
MIRKGTTGKNGANAASSFKVIVYDFTNYIIKSKAKDSCGQGSGQIIIK